MRPIDLIKAMGHAQRFLDESRMLLFLSTSTQRDQAGAEGSMYTHAKQRGAVKRASMDLTRSLADLRRRPKAVQNEAQSLAESGT